MREWEDDFTWSCVHVDGTRHDAPRDLLGHHTCDEQTDEHRAALSGVPS